MTGRKWKAVLMMVAKLWSDGNLALILVRQAGSLDHLCPLFQAGLGGCCTWLSGDYFPAAYDFHSYSLFFLTENSWNRHDLKTVYLHGTFINLFLDYVCTGGGNAAAHICVF